MTLLLSELRLKRFSLIAWTIAIILLVLMIIAFYPAVRGNDSLDSLYTDLPESAQALLGGSDLTSPVGYLNSQLFAFFLPAVLLVFGIGWGSASLAGEEEARTLDLLLAQPVPRWSAYVQKLGGIKVGLLLLTAATAVPLLLFNGVVEFDLAVVDVLAICVQMFLFCLVLSVAAQAIAAATGRKLMGTATVAGYAFVSYLVYGLASTVTWLQHLEPLSLWRWYLGNDPLVNGFGVKEIVVMVAVALVLWLAGTWAFGRRDLKA